MGSLGGVKGKGRSSTPVDMLRGFGLLLQGAGMVLRNGRRFRLGLVPPLLVGVAFTVLFGLVAWQAPGLAARVTDVAGLQSLLAAAVVVASALLMVVLFTATTLAVGAPVYDAISEDVDRAEGWPGGQSQSPAEAVGDAVRRLGSVVAVSVPVGLGLLLVGLIPVVGGPLAAVGSALYGGWMVALEMIGAPADRRGIRTLGARHRLLSRNRCLAWGFGVPTFFALSVPILAVAVFPMAAAGGTLLARRLAGEPSR